MGHRRRGRSQGELSPRACLQGGTPCGNYRQEGDLGTVLDVGAGPDGDIDMRCDLATGRCEAEYISAKSNLPTVRFRVAAAKLAPYTTISEDARYGEREMDPWMIYDGPYWEYILGTDDTVLLRGTRRGSAGKGKEPILSLLRSIRRSANRETRRLWGFAI